MKYDRFSYDWGYEAKTNLIKEFAYSHDVWKERTSYNASNSMNPTDRKQIIMHLKCLIEICRHYIEMYENIKRRKNWLRQIEGGGTTIE